VVLFRAKSNYIFCLTNPSDSLSTTWYTITCVFLICVTNFQCKAFMSIWPQLALEGDNYIFLYLWLLITVSSFCDFVFSMMLMIRLNATYIARLYMDHKISLLFDMNVYTFPHFWLEVLHLCSFLYVCFVNDVMINWSCNQISTYFSCPSYICILVQFIRNGKRLFLSIQPSRYFDDKIYLINFKYLFSWIIS
jgi:hypothetical protein